VDGWVKLHRSIKDNWVWKDKPFSKGQAWLDILMECNHKPGKVNIGLSVIPVERGQKLWSIKDMADQWGWSRKKVSSFLNVLEMDNMLHQKRTSKYTLLTIVNYDLYQSKDDEEEHQKNITGTSREHHGNTNKNVKNDKNINNKEYQKKYSDGSFEMKCVNYLPSSIKSEMPGAKLPTTDIAIDKWCDYIEKMIRIDKRPEDDIWNTLVFARADHFWKVNIRSTSKFREKYETLYLQMKNKKEPSQQSKVTNKFNQFPQREYSQKQMSEINRKLLNKALGGKL